MRAMTKHLFQRNIIYTALRVLICFTLLRSCDTRNSFEDLDLSTQTLNPAVTGFMITGNTPTDRLGVSVSKAGDINNDGYADIIVGACYKNSYQGAAYVIYGDEESSFLNIDLSSTTLDPLTTGFMITGNTAGDYLGGSVSPVGDINNDGYDDIIVGAHGKNSWQGAAYVIYGGEKSTMSNWDFSSGVTLNPSTTGFMITGYAVGDFFGFSVSTPGDINNDGYDDIIVAAPLKNGAQGGAYVIYGGAKSTMSNIVLSSTTLIPTSTGFVITGNAAGDIFGQSVSTAGDINNDGYDDIIVGAYAKNSNQGAAYVIYGGDKSSMTNIVVSSTTLIPTSTGFTITGNAVGDYFGYFVSTAGDIDHDGYDDIIVGAYAKNSNQGAAYVIYGGDKSTMSNIALSSTTLNPTSTGFMITGNGGSFGISVSTAGDIDNDGYDDIIVGANGKNSNQGAAYVIYGGDKSTMSNIALSSTTLNPTSTGFMITGNGGSFGLSVSTAGDINNDGYADIIVGALSKNTGQGAAYVIYASCSKNCKQCSSESVCTECKSSYLLYQSECLDSCPFTTFASTDSCEDCPAHCFYCTSQDSCIICSQGYTLSNSLCVLIPDSYSQASQGAQEKASKVLASATQGIGSVICVGSAVFPFSALVSKIVQNTRYLNLSVTSELAEVYETWSTDLISWDVPNVMSDLDHFETSPILFAQYDIDSPFLVNFWPTLINIGIGFSTFAACILLKKIFEHERYEGWAYSLVLKLVAGSFNFALIQAYACLDDILFYLVLDAKTNPFNSFFSWASMICAVIFLTVGCLQVFFNFWTVYKYQSIKNQGVQSLEVFNERNKYWQLFYSDFNDDDLWSQVFFAIAIIRSALSSFIITILYDYPLMQISYLVILDGVIILFLYFKSPFNTLRGKLAQYYYEIITLLVHICAFILGLQDSFDHSSATVRLIMSTGILYLNTALITGAIGFMFIEIYKTISEKNRAARLQKRQGIPEDNQEAQNLTRTGSALQLPEIRQDWTNQQSIEKNSFFPRNNQKLNSNFMNLESSQALEVDHSRELDIYPNNRIDQQRNESPRPIMIRHRPQAQLPPLPKDTGKQFHPSKSYNK